MTYKKSFLITGLALLAQPVLSSIVGFAGAIDPYMVLGVMALLMLRKEDGIPLVVGCLVMGFFKDQLLSIYPGIYVIALAVIFILSAYTKEKLNTDNPFILIFDVIIFTWVMKSILWLGYKALGSPYGYGFAMSNLIQYELANLLFAGICYFLLKNVGKQKVRNRYYR